MNSKAGFKREGPNREKCLEMLGKGDVYGVMVKISEKKAAFEPKLSAEEMQSLYRDYLEKSLEGEKYFGESDKRNPFRDLYSLAGKPPEEDIIAEIETIYNSSDKEAPNFERIDRTYRSIKEAFYWHCFQRNRMKWKGL